VLGHYKPLRLRAEMERSDDYGESYYDEVGFFKVSPDKEEPAWGFPGPASF